MWSRIRLELTVLELRNGVVRRQGRKSLIVQVTQVRTLYFILWTMKSSEKLNELAKVSISLFFFRATPVAHGRPQARSHIRAVAAGLHYSHSNAESKPRLQPTPQLKATPDP